MRAQSCPTLQPQEPAVAHHVPLSVGLSRQHCWSGLPFPPLGDLPDPGIEHTSPTLAGKFFTIEPPGKPDRPSDTHHFSRIFPFPPHSPNTVSKVRVVTIMVIGNGQSSFSCAHTSFLYGITHQTFISNQ